MREAMQVVIAIGTTRAQLPLVDDAAPAVGPSSPPPLWTSPPWWPSPPSCSSPPSYLSPPPPSSSPSAGPRARSSSPASRVGVRSMSAFSATPIAVSLYVRSIMGAPTHSNLFCQRAAMDEASKWPWFAAITCRQGSPSYSHAKLHGRSTKTPPGPVVRRAMQNSRVSRSPSPKTRASTSRGRRGGGGCFSHGCSSIVEWMTYPSEGSRASLLSPCSYSLSSSSSTQPSSCA